MADAIAAAVRQSPLVIRIPRSPAAPLLEVITGPYILETGLVGDPWIQVLEIAAPSILKCTGHHIDTGLLGLNHRLCLWAVASGTGAPWDIRELHINIWVSSLKHRFKLLDARDILPSDRIDAV